MTRSKIRENVFKMLSGQNFTMQTIWKEQLDLFDEELENPSESELFISTQRAKGFWNI